MKNLRKSNILFGLIFAFGMTMIIWSPAQAQSKEPAMKKDMMKSKVMEQCGEMKERKQNMMKDMMAQDSLLSEMVVKMNRAPEDKKVLVMADVITYLVEHRVSMIGEKAKMEEITMNHMMQHMKMGKESMSQCPMMNDMMNMDENSKDDNKVHHEKIK